MIGNPYPQFQSVQEWNDFVNEVRHALADMGKTITDLYTVVQQGGGGGGGYVVPDASATTKGIMKLYPSTGNNTDGTITQRALTVAQQEQDQRIAEIYATQTGMQTAIENATVNAVSMIELLITIPTTGWTASTMSDYPYKCTITNTNIKADLIPSLEFSGSDFEKAVTSGIAGTCETVEGGLVVYSTTIPTHAIDGTLRLQKINNAG